MKNNTSRLDYALGLHQQGQLDQAAALYQDLLQSEPQHLDALQLLATIALQRNEHAGALVLLDLAIGIDSLQAELHHGRGIALAGLGRPMDALGSHERALLIEPGHFGSHLSRGDVLLGFGRPLQALDSYAQALLLQPGNDIALNNRGLALGELERHAEALESHEQALLLRPGHGGFHYNRGNALRALQRPAPALESYEQALLIEPGHIGALINRGHALIDLQQPLLALESFEHALLLQPDHAGALKNRAHVLYELKRFEEALDSYGRVLLLQPDHGDVHYHRGLALHELRRLEEALASYDQALLHNPGHAGAHNNRGNVLQTLQRPQEALECYLQALSHDPDCLDAHWNESLCRLLLGDFGPGWQKYEWRWKAAHFIPAKRDFAQTLWLGQADLKDKTILLYAEQGLGDTIQFCRYARDVAAMGAKVILEVQAPLKTLMRSLHGVDVLLSQGESLPEFDYQSPLLSLPLAFQADFSSISNASYLCSDPEKRRAWHAKLMQNQKKKVALVWSGSTDHGNDANRSIAFGQLNVGLNLGSNQQIDFYCLQNELRPADQALLEETPAVVFFGSALEDFSDTAALLDLMDLVITVDTSVAHLAGAMGKPVWILLPFYADWRWLLERTDSPWYHSARLFRQPAMGDWASVLAQVAAALKVFSSAAQAMPPHAVSATAAPADDAKLNNALAHHQQGRFDQAEVLYEELLQSQPRDMELLRLLAASALGRNASETANTWFQRLLWIDPDQPDIHNNRGLVLVQLKRYQEALQSYERALLLDPGHVDAHNNRGNVLSDLQQFTHALHSYDRALLLQPDNVNASYNRGNALRQLNRPLEALHSYDKALLHEREHFGALNNRSIVLGALKRHAEALASCERALLLKPGHASVHNNLGLILSALKRPAQALVSYDNALHIEPDFADAHNNRGIALSELQRLGEALESYAQALKIVPEHPDAHNNESLCRLLMGDFAAGWPKYEWRWKTPKGLTLARNFGPALWLGQQDLSNKTILLYCEQGLGDTIQFCRYVRQVAALGAKVMLEVPASLKSLLRTLDGVALLLVQGDSLPAFDYQCPLLSLPLAFETDARSISKEPYLQSALAKRLLWQTRLNKNKKKRVGLVWSGNTEHPNDVNRSIALETLNAKINFASNHHIDFYCLQKELRPADQAFLEETPGIGFFGSALEDFSDTAALLDLMDLVITVDSSVAHLAGAMGKEVWILLPFYPDWRWLLERADSPWYRSASLFRQPAIGDWSSVLAQVAFKLKIFTNAVTARAEKMV